MALMNGALQSSLFELQLVTYKLLQEVTVLEIKAVLDAVGYIYHGVTHLDLFKGSDCCRNSKLSEGYKMMKSASLLKVDYRIEENEIYQIALKEVALKSG